MRVRRSLLNFGTMVLFTAVTTTIALYATPLLVEWLGEKPFGAFRVVNDGYGYLTLLELGLGGAVGPLLARAVAQDDEAALHETVAAGAWAYGKVSLWTLGVGLAVTPVVPWLARDLQGADVIDLQVAWLVGLTAFLSLGLLPFRTVVEARQLGYVVNLLLTLQALGVTLLSLGLARAGWGITGQAMALVAGVWGFNLVLACAVLRSRPGLLRAVVAGPTRPETLRDLRSLSLPALLINLSGRISILTDNMIVGSMLGTRRVTALYTTQRLASLGQTVLQGVGSATWAALAELHGRGERATFNRRLVELSRLIAILSAGGLAPVVAYNRAFIHLWMGREFPYAGDLVIVFAALNVVLLAEQSLWAWCFSATGNLRLLVVPSIVAAAVNFGASVLLTYQIGLAGPILGTTIGCSAVGLWVLPWKLRDVFGTPLGPLARAVALPTAWGVLASAGLYGLTRHHQPASWWLLGLEMSLAAVVVLAVGFAVFLPPDEREHWRVRLGAIERERSSS
jgi:O-antigen/teichoic acid export membrane protein